METDWILHWCRSASDAKPLWLVSRPIGRIVTVTGALELPCTHLSVAKWTVSSPEVDE